MSWRELEALFFGEPWVWSAAGGEFLLQPSALAVFLSALLVLSLLARRSLADLPRRQVALATIVRALFLFALTLTMTDFRRSEATDRVCAAVLVDVSESQTDTDVGRGRDFALRLLSEARSDDTVALVPFAKQARVVFLDRQKEARPELELAELRASVTRGATDVARAIDLSLGALSGRCLPRLVVVSDGIETRGDAASAIVGLEDRLVRSRSGRLRVGTLLPDRNDLVDSLVEEIRLPVGVRRGERFSLIVTLRSSSTATGILSVEQVTSGHRKRFEERVTLDVKDAKRVSFETVVQEAGVATWEARFTPDGPEPLLENNRRSVSAELPGPPEILLVDREPGAATPLFDALSAQDFKVTLRSPQAFPRSDAELRNYSFVILSDVPKSVFSVEAEERVLGFVRAGGALLFAGGASTYGSGGWQNSVLERHLPLRVFAEDRRETPQVALALVIDRSGSMTGLPLEMAKLACRATLAILEPSDLIEVIAFDSKPSRAVRLQRVGTRATIEADIARIQPGGGTEIFQSVDMAYQDLAATDARKKHMIVLTDGNADADGIYELATAAFAEGITLTTVGLGGGTNEALLRMMAEAGGGRYHHAADPAQLPRIFTRETELLSGEEDEDRWFDISAVGNHDFLRGTRIEEAPPLRGATRLRLAPSPAEPLLVLETGDPLLARQRVGLGVTLAWASDLKPRWATDVLRWRGFEKWMGQLVRAHLFHDDRQVRPLQLSWRGAELVLALDAFSSEDRFDNRLRSSFEIRAVGAPTTEPLRGELALVGPGRYEARVEFDRLGDFVVEAEHHRESGQPDGISRESIGRTYLEEFSDFRIRRQFLKSAVDRTGGQVNWQVQDVLERAGQRVETERRLYGPVLGLAALLLVLDVFLRRVRLFDREFKDRRSFAGAASSGTERRAVS